MKKRFWGMCCCVCFISFFLLSFNKPVSGAQGVYNVPLLRAQQPVLLAVNAYTQSSQSDLYAQAEKLFKERKYNKVINLLLGPCYNNPTNVELNVLLAKAQLEKCVILKAKGDKSYKTLVKQPYISGRRLHKMVRTNPELYYIVAKSLLINNRPHRAARTIKKALYFAPRNADYLIVLGDTYYAQAKAKKDDEDQYYANQLISKAKDAYNNALKTRSDDDVFRVVVEKRIEQLSEKVKK